MSDTHNPGTPSAPDERRGAADVPMSAMAIAGLVIGIIALITSALPIINNASFFLGLLGAVFAVVGTVAAVRGTRRGKGLAIAALVVCIASIVVVLATQSLYSAAIDESLSTQGSSDGAASQAAPSTDGQGASQDEVSSEYAVTIDDCTTTTDYAGEPAIVVTYTFENNSDKATSFMVAIDDECYQNGVQLDFAVVDDADSQSSMNDVKPGASTTVQKAYLLDDESDVTVECKELISFDDVMLAEKTFSVA